MLRETPPSWKIPLEKNPFFNTSHRGISHCTFEGTTFQRGASLSVFSPFNPSLTSPVTSLSMTIAWWRDPPSSWNIDTIASLTFYEVVDHCVIIIFLWKRINLDDDYPSLKLCLSTFASSDLAFRKIQCCWVFFSWEINYFFFTFQLEGVHRILRICDVPNIVRPTYDLSGYQW